MSHNVENLSLDIGNRYYEKYKLPDFFYNSSTFKQLKIGFYRNVPLECNVSWTSLRKLSLRFCSLSDESMAKMLSGCPFLEKLTLYYSGKLKVLDLRKSLRLREVRSVSVAGPTQIVAPHIHCLRLINSQSSCPLVDVDVDSLTEAELEICSVSMDSQFKADFLQVWVLEMLEKLQNAEKLKFGSNIVQILSIAEIRGAHFPLLKVKSLILGTKIFQYVIPGIERLLQNSDLEQLELRAWAGNTISADFLDIYMRFQGFNLKECWISKNGFSWNKHCVDLNTMHVASLVEHLLNNIDKLDKMAGLLDELYLKFKGEDVVSTLSHNNNVTVVFSSTNKPMTTEESTFRVTPSLFNL